MIFKVSKNFKGSCVLPTLKKAIWANMTVSISGNDLRANDIKDIVRKGILIPVDEKYDVEETQKDHDVIIINNTNKVLILGQTTLRPNGSLPFSKDEAKLPAIIAAAEDGFITILSDEGEEPYIKRKKVVKKKKITKNIKETDYVIPESGEDKEPTAVVWNFKTKEVEEAEKVPNCEDVVRIDEEIEDVDFIDKKDEVKPQRKLVKKKVVKKKVVSNKKTKKKEKTAKSKKVKELKPVGEKRLPKTVADAAIELDSRGNPIGDKPGDTLQHLIDSLNLPEDVDFVDQEQAKDRYQKRNDVNYPHHKGGGL